MFTNCQFVLEKLKCYEYPFTVNKKPAIVRNTRSNTKRVQDETNPIGQPMVVLTDLIYTIGKEKLAEYRAAAGENSMDSKAMILILIQ